ncbi:nitrile hydratase subunit beta [Sphingomonas sp. BN140010]|uniref:Nitrile hydratase subunit beta n=1 Tax=Sphingomonas arvum TaxID=2992113 RepID=A0ABT3JEK2_9SPHN|nr:nitrile hydratase subunit beta [Sphingomonas sp. BN140010]MCW3797200.1 nitrile hydratase subunit beta [Sphingomonas sp. BN140010]
MQTLSKVVHADREDPVFEPGDRVQIDDRQPIGHYRVPTYMRGKPATVIAAIRPTMVDNEAESFGRNAGSRRHYYRVFVPMTELWSDYRGTDNDGLYIEIFETWLKRAEP